MMSSLNSPASLCPALCHCPQFSFTRLPKRRYYHINLNPSFCLPPSLSLSLFLSLSLPMCSTGVMSSTCLTGRVYHVITGLLYLSLAPPPLFSLLVVPLFPLPCPSDKSFISFELLSGRGVDKHSPALNLNSQPRT